jgi:predicted nuclease with TOPRIM domain
VEKLTAISANLRELLWKAEELKNKMKELEDEFNSSEAAEARNKFNCSMYNLIDFITEMFTDLKLMEEAMHSIELLQEIKKRGLN